VRVAMIETGGWGGIAHYTWNLCQALAAEGADVVLLTNGRYELVGLRRRFGVESCFDAAVGYFRTVATLLRRLSVLRPDVLHVQSAISTRFDALLWPIVRWRMPLVYTVHNVRSHEDTPWESWTLWRSVRAADGVIVHTQESAQALAAKAPRALVRVVHHGDYSFFGAGTGCDRNASRLRLRLREDGKIILAFGAIRPYKGILELISALPAVRRHHPTAHLVVVGPLLVGAEAEYRQAIARAGVETAVTLHARYVPHADVAAYFAAADVAVYNYHDVTDSGSLRIACSLGVPVVATTVGAFREFLADGETGRLIPPHAPDRLAIAVSEVLADPVGAARMAAAARHLVVSHWSWTDSAKATLALYAEARKARGGGTNPSIQPEQTGGGS
jgi:glycosyltransferase involved in cell wall biosynthesis